jgi:hypothetical protein
VAIIIKKRVSLDFLGDEYTEAYLVFRSIPAVDFDDVMVQLKSLEEKAEGSITFILEILKKYFLSGGFPNDAGILESVAAEDLDGIDPQTLVQCFKVFTGQELDPKVETPLTTSSSTELNLPENS